MKAMILAAGKGERMRPLTDQCPKPLLKVQGRPLVEHTILKLRAAGFRDLVINLSYLGEMIENYLQDGSRYDVRICYSRESEPLETGGGIQQALPLLTADGNNPFVLINADVWTQFNPGHLKNALHKNDLAHLVLVPNPSHNPRGDFYYGGGRAEPRDDKRPAYTYSGIAVIHPDLIRRFSPAADKFPLLPLLLRAMDEKRVSAELYEGLWVDVGTPARLASLG